MTAFPLDREVVAELVRERGINLAKGTIREMNLLVNELEQRFGVSFIRMEFGVPGLKAAGLAADAEAALLREGAANTYPPFQGTPELKQAASRFAKAFMDLEIDPGYIIPTVGAMQGCFISIGLAGCHRPETDTILFLDPGFPVNKLQTRFFGLKSESLDLKHFRGQALIDEVDRLCAGGHIGGCMWSSPNNPAWVVLTEDELKGLAEVFERRQVIAIEDQAYFGMDFREDYSVPFEAPFQPTIARYTDRVFIVLSSSKLFSYAGQRCGLTLMPNAFGETRFPNLVHRFTKEKVIEAFVHGGIYPTTSGVGQGPQRGLAALMDAAVDGRYNPWETVREYQRRASFMKRVFRENGFQLVYADDDGKPLADGFYFTISYPGMDGGQLAEALIRYGVSAITLKVTGSTQEGLRACVSLFRKEQEPELEQRLAAFHREHQGG